MDHNMNHNFKTNFAVILITAIVVSSVCGAGAGFWAGLTARGNAGLAGGQEQGNQSVGGEKVVQVDEESAIVTAVEKVSPAVVSIIVSKDLPAVEQYYSGPFGSDFFRQFFGDDFNDFFGVPRNNQPNQQQPDNNGGQKTEIGGGSGFIISADGYVVTNKHVVADEEADYTVLMNDESKYEAKVLARDPVSDLAILKIEGDNFPTVELGDSANLKAGQTVIAIGNALGEFRNTVSTGVISGLSRSVTAGGAGIGAEELVGVIQTDASINPGNSGGPLLNIAGQVIGINTAMASQAENIGFAIPINDVKDTIANVQQNGRLVRPWLGVRYVMLNSDIAKANNLSVDYGALIVRGEARTDLAVIPGSPADKAGLAENDIILEVNGQKIDEGNTLAKAIGKFKAGDAITLKVLHQGKEKEIKVTLEEMG